MVFNLKDFVYISAQRFCADLQDKDEILSTKFFNGFVQRVIRPCIIDAYQNYKFLMIHEFYKQTTLLQDNEAYSIEKCKSVTNNPQKKLINWEILYIRKKTGS